MAEVLAVETPRRTPVPPAGPYTGGEQLAQLTTKVAALESVTAGLETGPWLPIASYSAKLEPPAGGTLEVPEVRKVGPNIQFRGIFYLKAAQKLAVNEVLFTCPIMPINPIWINWPGLPNPSIVTLQMRIQTNYAERAAFKYEANGESPEGGGTAMCLFLFGFPLLAWA
jgi:hypothetical protein